MKLKIKPKLFSTLSILPFLLSLFYSISYASPILHQIPSIRAARLCQDFLTSSQTPRAFGNFRLDQVSSEFKVLFDVFGKRTGRVMYEPGQHAIVLYLKGFEFEFAVQQSEKLIWVPSKVLGDVIAHRSVNGTGLEGSDILDIKPEFPLYLRWLFALNHARAALIEDSLDPVVAFSYMDLGVISQFTRKQMEAILFATLSGPIVPELHQETSETLQKKRILVEGGFTKPQAAQIAKVLTRESYSISYSSNPVFYPFTEVEKSAIASLFWTSSRPEITPPPPLPSR